MPGSSALVAEEGANETFTVNGSQLVLNLTASGGELDMCIQRPEADGGNASGDALQESCDETATTEDGNASFQASQPASGEWSVRLTAAEPSPSEIEYDLVIAQRLQEEGSADASTAVR